MHAKQANNLLIIDRKLKTKKSLAVPQAPPPKGGFLDVQMKCLYIEGMRHKKDIIPPTWIIILIAISIILFFTVLLPNMVEIGYLTSPFTQNPK